MLLAQQAGVPYRVAPEARNVVPQSRRSTSKPRRSDTVVSARPSRAPPPATRTPRAPAAADALIIGDAVRLLAWGRQWHELPEIIVGLDNRPAVTQIRRVLREHRTLIETRHTSSPAR